METQEKRCELINSMLALEIDLKAREFALSKMDKKNDFISVYDVFGLGVKDLDQQRVTIFMGEKPDRKPYVLKPSKYHEYDRFWLEEVKRLINKVLS